MSGVSIAGKEAVVMEKIFEHKCPSCGSDDLEYDIIEPQDEYLKQDVCCNKCNHAFIIWSETKWFYDTE